MGVVIEMCVKCFGGRTRMRVADVLMYSRVSVATAHAQRVVILIVFTRKCRVRFRHFGPNTGYFRHFRPNTGYFRPKI
jgi:hypothetical protein